MFGNNSHHEYDETNGIQFKGLKNQGATSHLNALFQCLFFIPELREGIYNLTEKELGIQHIKNNKYKLKDEDIFKLTLLGYTPTRAKRALVKAENNYETAVHLLKTNNVSSQSSVKRILIELRHLFSLLSSGNESSISTKSLSAAFGCISREIYQQNDVHELYRILIDAIDRELKDTKSENLIKSIYEGQMVSRTLCLECEYVSERRENFLDAIIQIKDCQTLHESLSIQCQSEYLVGDNKYFCDRCNQKGHAKRSVAYTKLPNVLTLALNRFIFNLYTLNREKCTDRFEFPLIFDFEPFLDEQLSNKQRRRTVEDEEILKEEIEEYLKEQKDKEAAKQKRIKKEQRRRQQQAQNNNMNKEQNVFNESRDKIDIIIHPEPDGMDIMRRYGTEWNKYYNSSTNSTCSEYNGKNLKLCKPKINLNSNHLYALIGVLIHRGTPHAGHYHIYLKDYMKEGKYQKIIKRNDSNKEKEKEKEKEIKEEEEEKEAEDVEIGKFINTICDDALWYNFNDSSIYRIPPNKVAKQYGGHDECAYMLIYKKINKKLGKELMNKPNIKLPPDLIEYVKKHNVKIEEERKTKEAKANEIMMQIIHPNCFNVKDNKYLTMNPFIQSLLKKIIRLSRERRKNDGEFDKKEEEKQIKEKLEEEEIEKLYLEKSWPINMSSMDIYKIVQEHFKQKSIFITCDGRQNVNKLIPLIYKRLQQENIENTQLNEENIKLHFISIPSAFQDDKIECKSIANLLNSNIAPNVDDLIFPIKLKPLKEEEDDEYRYKRMPKKIGELPFKKFDFIMNARACFVWNGGDVNGTKFDLKITRSVDIQY